MNGNSKQISLNANSVNQVNASNFSILDNTILQRSRSKSKSNEKYKGSEENDRPKSYKQSRFDIKKVNHLLNNSKRKMNKNDRN